MSNLSKNKIDKDNFLDFLSSYTPEDINKLIEEKGKPPKLWTPVYFFRYPEQQMEVLNNEQSG